MSLRERTADLVATDEGWEDSAFSRILLVLTGALLFRAGFMLWATIEPNGIFQAVSIILLYGAGCQLLLFAVTGLPLEAHGRKVALAVAATMTLAMLAAIARGFSQALGTDAMAFAARAVDLTLAGENPYAASMLPAMERPESAHEFATPQMDGTSVASLSYPAGSVLAFVPAAVAGVELRVVSVLGAAAVSGWLIRESPARAALGGVVAAMAGANLWLSAAQGNFGTLWILPTLVTMGLWASGRRTAAAAVFGVACSVKQQPWVMLPFLAIWTYHETGGGRAFARAATRRIGAGLATFGVINLPFVVADPAAWLGGVLTPVAGGAPLVHQGVGIALLAPVGIVALPTWYHALLVASVAIVMLTAYSLYFEQVKWVAWVAPVAIWLVHSRSLVSYFAFLVPIAYYAVLLQWEVGPRFREAPA